MPALTVLKAHLPKTEMYNIRFGLIIVSVPLQYMDGPMPAIMPAKTNTTWPFSFQQGLNAGNPSPRSPWELSPPPERPRGGPDPPSPLEESPTLNTPAHYHLGYPQAYSDALLQLG
ncbi:hypothetical protein J6590_017687 [Homalodisca vitripennis]|nr:hypothetical protein J6590_017687 [Homalodisca vitripennis]